MEENKFQYSFLGEKRDKVTKPWLELAALDPTPLRSYPASPLGPHYRQLFRLLADVITKITIAEFDLQKHYDSLLTLFDELLKDESPLSRNEDSLLVIDDNLLQLKLWGNAIRAKDGTLQKTSLDKYFALSVQQMLQEIQDHLLHYVERVSSSGDLATRETGLGYVTPRSILCCTMKALFEVISDFNGISQNHRLVRKS